MRNKIVLTLLGSVSAALLIGCESELEEVKPVVTTEVSKEKLADTDGLKTKIFFPKDPDR